MEYFNNLDIVLKAFWYIAIPASFVFILQAVLTFIGTDSDINIESDNSSNELFSLRNLVNFLLGFSWTGIAIFPIIQNLLFLVTISLLVGLVFVYLHFIIIKQIYKLNEDNTFKISNTLLKTAEVYLNIPEKMTGKGKVLISVGGSIHELDAMTESDKLMSGSMVVIVRIEDNILIVEPI